MRVLICDDLPDIRALVRHALERDLDLYVCGEAEHGFEAAEMVREWHPDVVILDLSMPRADGLEGITAIRRAAPRTGIVVFTSFPGDAGMRDRTLSLGADRYLEKGVSLDVLRQTVREVGQAKVGLFAERDQHAA